MIETGADPLVFVEITEVLNDYFRRYVMLSENRHPILSAFRQQRGGQMVFDLRDFGGRIQAKRSAQTRDCVRVAAFDGDRACLALHKPL